MAVNEREDGFLTKEEWMKIGDLTRQCADACRIDPKFYEQYDVKKGLRDLDGRGVLAGLTEISEIRSMDTVDGKRVPVEGELYYRGINVNELVKGFLQDGRAGFEETTYLLLTGKLPTERELKSFCSLLGEFYTLPKNFVRDIIMKSPSSDMMNTLMRCVLSLFPYDPDPNNTSPENVMRQCLQLIAEVPIFAVYSYAAANFYNNNDSLVIHRPQPSLSMAENILYMLRQDCRYTELEARVLDMALVLHAEHGGGNNSSFTTHVVTSSGTDTYSAIAAALASLKGPRHGGANIRVMQMFDDMKKHIDTRDDGQLAEYLNALVDGKAFDGAGLIYGIGHAVYSISDPRAKIFKEFVEKLRTKRDCTRSTNCTRAWKSLRPRSSAKSARSTRASRRMWTFTAGLPIGF